MVKPLKDYFKIMEIRKQSYNKLGFDIRNL